jgi:hypothetical protein
MTQDSLPTDPPARRRTHATQAITDALKKLPRALKLSRNKAIEGRNTERAVRNAEHAHDPVVHPEAASDDESLLTVSDHPIDALSPLGKVKRLVEKLSPSSARFYYFYLLTLILSFQLAFGPRSRDFPRFESTTPSHAELTI